MFTDVSCPKCERLFQVPPELLGKRLRCLQCQYVFALESDERARRSLSKADSPEDEARHFERIDHGIPGYLGLFAALPWCLLVLALGGFVWGVSAGFVATGLFAVGMTLMKARQWSVALRLAGLLVLDGVVGFLIIVGGTLCVLGSLSDSASPQAAANQPDSSRQPKPPSTVAGLAPGSPLFTKGPRLYLAEMQEFDVVSGPWPFNKNGTIGDGRPIRVNRVLSRKGLNMHPPPAPAYAAVHYLLGKQAKLFRAVAAINETSDRCASPATFTVFGDGRTLWQSGPIDPTRTRSQECRVDVSGVNLLELRVECANGNSGVHAVWIQPRLLQQANTPDE